MVTEIITQNKSVHENGEKSMHSEYYGLSTDTKPKKADGVENADLFFEMDKAQNADGSLVNKVYIFDADSDNWLQL